MLVKQFAAGGRCVFVWHAVAEWPQVGAARNVKTYEDGWGIHLDPSEYDARICQSYSLVTSTMEGVTNKEKLTTIEHLGELYQSVILARLQRLENRTIDAVMLEERRVATC